MSGRKPRVHIPGKACQSLPPAFVQISRGSWGFAEPLRGLRNNSRALSSGLRKHVQGFVEPSEVRLPSANLL